MTDWTRASAAQMADALAAGEVTSVQLTQAHLDRIAAVDGDVHAFLQQNPDWIVLDVRTEPEFDEHRIAGARLLPIQELQERLDELDPTNRYVVVCEHGMRSQMACAFLAEQGFASLINARGGMAHWLDVGLPVERGGG